MVCGQESIFFRLGGKYLLFYFYLSCPNNPFLQGIIMGLVLMIGALVVETLLFSIRLSNVDMKKEKVDKQNQERERNERIHGGYPNLLLFILSLSPISLFNLIV